MTTPRLSVKRSAPLRVRGLMEVLFSPNAGLPYIQQDARPCWHSCMHAQYKRAGPRPLGWGDAKPFV